jgi:hypothetical protein
MDNPDVAQWDIGTKRAVRTVYAVVFATAFFVAGTRSIQGQPHGSAPLRIVLVEADASIDRARFLNALRKSAIVETGDASNNGVKLADLGEGDIGEVGRHFRMEWPADVYVRLGVTHDDGYYHGIQTSIPTEDDYGWETCRIDVAVRDGKTGRLLANFSTTQAEDWASSDSLRGRAEVRPPWVAANAATAKALDAAARLSLKNLGGRLTAK